MTGTTLALVAGPPVALYFLTEHRIRLTWRAWRRRLAQVDAILDRPPDE